MLIYNKCKMAESANKENKFDIYMLQNTKNRLC